MFPCSVNSIPFYPAESMQRRTDAVANFGQAPYLDTLLHWQSKLPYLNKRLSDDKMTFQFKTQKNSEIIVTPIAPPNVKYVYTNYAKLYICNSISNADGTPIPNEIVVDADLNVGDITIPGSVFWGIQDADYDIYTNPLTGDQIPLVSYMWSFRFADFFLDMELFSGIYFIRFDNIDVDGGIQTWYSEPILFYGTNANIAVKDTLNFEGTSAINKNDFLLDGWFNEDGRQVIFYNRVEGDILDYEQVGIYNGYLQQNWLAQNTYINSFKKWNLNIGSVTNGIPITLFEIIAKFMELDYIIINNQYYVYDIQNGGSDSPSAAWKIDKARNRKLVRANLPIRYKFENQFFLGNGIEIIRIFDGTFDGVFG